VATGSEDSKGDSERRTAAQFATTHWSVVLAAGQMDTPQAGQALETLCQTYWYPLYAFARRQGHAPEDAQDLTQAFFERFLERGMCRRQTLIVPMNLRDSPSAEVTRSMAVVGFGAFVPVGEIGSGARHFNCLVTPARVFPLGSFAFFCVRSGRVASALNSKLESPPSPVGRGLCCRRWRANSERAFISNDFRLTRFMGR